MHQFPKRATIAMAAAFTTLLFASSVEASADNGGAPRSNVSSAECKRAMQFAWFKHQLSLTDGGSTEAAAPGTPRECVDEQLAQEARGNAGKTPTESASRDAVAMRSAY